jgi:hypothetical protein
VTPLPLISPKPFTGYTADEYHAYVTAMYALPVKRGAKPKSPVSGLAVTRGEAGELRVRRTAKARPFPYATIAEVKLLADHVKCGQAELWNLLKAKKFILGQTRMECEKIYAEIEEIPWR